MTTSSRRNGPVVVITTRGDAHLEFVARHLQETELLVVDPHAVAEGVELTYELAGSELVVRWDGRRLDDARAVWYRKPKPFGQADLLVPPESRRYCETALAAHTRALEQAFPAIPWISHPSLLSNARAKPAQLALARRVGLQVPPTLITSDSTQAREFVRATVPCVVKPEATEFPAADGYFMAFYTTRIEPDGDFDELTLAPAIFQRAVETSHSLRLVVVGEQVFVSRIDTEPTEKPSPVTDWKFDESENRAHFQPYRDLDPTTARACVELVRRFGLRFGVLDLLVDRQGQIWFLEVNANGQWAFVDDETTFLIGQALGRLLEGADAKGGCR